MLGTVPCLLLRHIAHKLTPSSCVPKKVSWNAAAIAETLEQAKGYGFDVEVKGFDWEGFVAKRDAYITRLNGIYSRNLNNDSVTYIPVRARAPVL